MLHNLFFYFLNLPGRLFRAELNFFLSLGNKQTPSLETFFYLNANLISFLFVLSSFRATAILHDVKIIHFKSYLGTNIHSIPTVPLFPFSPGTCSL